jgi:phosphate starvation-inducible PhoH-like protein
MRVKRSKAIDDFDPENIVASLAAGGGGSANCRAISPVYTPRTANQKTYVKYLGEPDTKIVLGVGAAGSGKTLFACYSAIQELRQGSIAKIIMTRPVVPVEEEEIGFLPGSLINKMDPWTRPIFDILLEFYAQKDIDAMLHGGVIEISPLAFMRGRTFKRSFIIADEMQNSSPNQMLMLTTRLGEGSKMVITGDLKQSDRGVDNGLADLLRKLKTYNEKEGGVDRSSNRTTAIKYVELESADVQRSAIVSKILDIYGGSTSAKSEPAIQAVNKELGLAEAKPLSTKKTIQETGNNDAALMPIHHVSKYIRKN